MSSCGKFITFEGPEGSGKSTHASALIERMRLAGYDVLMIREPGGTRIGESIRRLLKRNTTDKPICAESELFLFLASRAQLVQNVIQPALKKGVHVVCDRFADSTTVYQGYGRGYDIQQIRMINDIAVHGLVPDLTILLDIDVESGFKRIKKRHHKNHTQMDRIESEAFAFHKRVRAGYLELARRWPERFRCIDTSHSVSAVREQVWKEAQSAIRR